MSQHRIAILISLMLAMPAAVVAVEQAASSLPPEASAAQPVAAEPAAQPVAEKSEQIIGTAPVGGIVRATPSDTFPKGSDVEWELLPPLAAYLEQVEEQRRHLVARGDVFPMGDSDTEWQALPVQVAYFDRIERERVAGAQPEQPANPVQAEAAPAAATRNPLRVAMDYVTGLFKSDSPGTPADNTAAK